MPHKEIIHSVEIKSREAFLLLLTILTLLIIGVVSVEASDEESLWNSLSERGAIELILDDTFEGDIHSVVEFANQATVEQAQNQEVSYPQVNIPNGVNVRSLEASASTLQNFPRGAADVIGWFNADGTSNFGRAAQGVWLVVSVDGQTGAVFADFVNQTDGTDLTADEMASAGVPEFTVEGGIPTPPADEDTTEEDTTTGGDGDDEESTSTPESLVVPELPSSFTTRINVFENGTFVQREITIEVNQDEIMALPLGVIDFELYPQFAQFAQQIEANMSGGNRTTMEPLRSIGIHVVYAGRTGTAESGYSHHYAFQREDGTWATIMTGGRGSIAVLNVGRDLLPTNASSATNLEVVQADVRLGNSRLELSPNPVMPGESVIIYVYSSRDTETGVEDQGPYAQGTRGACEGRNTDETLDFIAEDESNNCTLSNGTEITGAVFTATGFAALNE